MLGPLDWLRLGSLGGAQALGLDDVTGSLEVGKEADMIAIDPAFVAPLPGGRPTTTRPTSQPPRSSAPIPTWFARPGSADARLEGPGARG